MIKVFWLEPVLRDRFTLRRFTGNPRDGRPGCSTKVAGGVAVEWAFHDAEVVIGEGPRDAADPWDGAVDHEPPHDDPRWPTHCACGYAFVEADRWHAHRSHLYQAMQGPHAGQCFTLQDAPIGAMWDASWLRREECPSANNVHVGPDGLCLIVKTPGGDWAVDAQCSNCTRPQELPVEGKPGWTRFVRTHWCWVRHGDPRTGEVHVDKVGDTCAAGAGSILTGRYHGFLHHGHLVPC
jgi:hypothetical protein